MCCYNCYIKLNTNNPNCCASCRTVYPPETIHVINNINNINNNIFAVYACNIYYIIIY